MAGHLNLRAAEPVYFPPCWCRHPRGSDDKSVPPFVFHLSPYPPKPSWSLVTCQLCLLPGTLSAPDVPQLARLHRPWLVFRSARDTGVSPPLRWGARSQVSLTAGLRLEKQCLRLYFCFGLKLCNSLPYRRLCMN